MGLESTELMQAYKQGPINSRQYIAWINGSKDVSDLLADPVLGINEHFFSKQESWQ